MTMHKPVIYIVDYEERRENQPLFQRESEGEDAASLPFPPHFLFSFTRPIRLILMLLMPSPQLTLRQNYALPSRT